MSWEPEPQSTWVAEANRGEQPDYAPRPGRFEAGRLIEAALARSAAAKTSISDELLEPLGVFCDALEIEANLTPLGRWATQRYLDRLLDQRILLDELARQVDVVNQVIEQPIFVVGPPRSGTTVLHRLLAGDPAHRVTEGWEVLFPATAGTFEAGTFEAGTFEDDALRQAASDELGFPQSVSQGLRTIHTYSATMPKECLSAMAFSFRTEEFISRYNVPSYVEWLQSADMRPAYDMHRLVLQVLQSRSTDGRRWVLKSPVHLQSLPELAATYPDAGLVVTHREPAEVLASVSSLLANLRAAFSEHVDPEAIGRYHLDLYRRSLGELAGHLQSGLFDSSQIVDAYHSDIVSDPGDVLHRISDRLGLDIAGEPTNESSEERDDRLGAHRYEAADFGLDLAEIDGAFADYRQAFFPPSSRD